MAKRTNMPRPPSEKTATEPDDAFVAKVVEVSTWAGKNTQTLTLVGIAVVLVAAAGIYYFNFRDTLETQSVQELESILQVVVLGDRDAAKADLSLFLDRYASTSVAAEARLLLGQLYLESGQPDVAIDVLQASSQSIADPVGTQTHMLTAKAFESAGRLEQAESLYRRLADRAEMSFQRVEALDGAARVRLQLGDHAGAADLFDQILEDLEEGDVQRGYFEMRATEARARG